MRPITYYLRLRFCLRVERLPLHGGIRRREHDGSTTSHHHHACAIVNWSAPTGSPTQVFSTSFPNRHPVCQYAGPDECAEALARPCSELPPDCCNAAPLSLLSLFRFRGQLSHVVAGASQLILRRKEGHAEAEVETEDSPWVDFLAECEARGLTTRRLGSFHVEDNREPDDVLVYAVGRDPQRVASLPALMG